MGSHAAIFRGTEEGGPIVVPGDANSSRIVEVLSSGEMPRGGPRFSEMELAAVQGWVREGAKFDGRNANDSLAALAAQLLGSLSAEELSAMRRETMQANWSKTMPGTMPVIVESLNFLVVSNLPREQIVEGSELAEQQLRDIARWSGIPNNNNRNLLKGRVTIYLFAQRYDYSEFGQMVETRDLPRNQRRHQRYSVKDAYGAAILEDGWNDDATFGLTQMIATLWMSSQGAFPNWFCEGCGAVAATTLHRKSTQGTAWDDALAGVAQRMEKVEQLTDSANESDDALIARYGFVSVLTTNRTRFQSLIKQVAGGAEFEPTFTAIYRASPSDAIVAWRNRAATSPTPRRRNRR